MSSNTKYLRGPFDWARNLEYSQAVKTQGLVFVSGQYGAGSEGEVVSDDFREQTIATFENLKKVLQASGSDFSKVVQMKCYILDGADYPIFKEVRRSFMPEGVSPASVVMCVPAFAFKGMKIEVEAVAEV
ncbi:RidA family protein [Rouxiella badensis]|uniref:RidA family protein n=1 Tax=Rouxiella badensis TaxID=1646377 RepID=UPI0022AA5F68|nr:RidA family protein [Rouxiella badensis]WAT09668.1 RidA family protein [Rouxiella badensis]